MAPPRNTLTAATGPRRFQIAPAVRRAVVLKIGISGPSGSGKTTSAVLLAYGLVSGAHPDWTPEECWAKIAVADTENRSAAYLVGRTFLSSALVDGKVAERHVTVGEFLHVPFEPPYDPETWIDLIRQVEMSGAEVLVLDDFGAHKSSEWAEERLFHLIDQRYSARKTLIVTTNMTLQELPARVKSRLASGSVVNFANIPDRRLAS